MTGWWLGVPAAQTTVPCGDEQHRLRWEAGALHALDHEDAEAERALAALGGERCRCVDVLDAWARHTADLRVLVLASRGPADPLVVQEDAPPRMGLRPGGGWTATASATLYIGSAQMAGVQAPDEPDDDLLELLGLGGGLQDRLAATVAAGRAGDASARSQLHAALYGRAVSALRGWLAQPGLEVDLSLVEPERAAVARHDGGLRAELPLWLVDVWARGLATVGGRFCLTAATADGRSFRLSTLGPDLGAPQPVTLELP